MFEKQARSIFRDLTEQKAPKAEIDLWPSIESSLARVCSQTSEPTKRRKSKMNTHQLPISRLRLVTATVLITIIAGALLFATPKGQAVAQNILHFFNRSESNQLPIQPSQLTTSPGASENPAVDPASITDAELTTSPTTPENRAVDPASIIDADLSIEEVQQQAGFDVYVPSWIPDDLNFSAATFEPENKIVRIFYRLFDTNGLVLRQEQIPMTDACELCGKVGADAAIQEVSIAGVYGEYVEGVWKLTEKGAVWEDDPYLKGMRWQEGGMAFEMLYMGPPDTLSKEDMIAIAESMK